MLGNERPLHQWGAVIIYSFAVVSSVLRAIKGFPRFVWDVAKIWYHGGIGDLAAGVTFWILITVPAAALTFFSSASFVDDLLGVQVEGEVKFRIFRFVNRMFGDVALTVNEIVRDLFEQSRSGVFTLAAGLTLFTISRGFAGMIRALDTVYEVENGRPWYHTRFVGLILGLGTVLVIVPTVLVELLVWSAVSVPAEATLSAAVSMLILVGWASLIFHFGPSTRSRWRWDLPGALVAAVFWWGLAVGFGRFVSVFTLTGGGGNSALGIISVFLIGITWLWLAAQVLLIGAAVNRVVGDRLNLDRGRKRSVITALSNATGELKKVVVNTGREGEGSELSPKAVAQRLKPVNRARSVLDLREYQDVTEEIPRDRVS